jgi:hypothetical protein
VYKEAQLTTMMFLAAGIALVGWGVVHLASAPSRPHKDEHRATGFRRWLAATLHRLLEARE